MLELKTCRVCARQKLATAFHKGPRGTRGNTCHRCHHRARDFDITVEKLRVLLAEHPGGCEICGAPAECIDHDHETGRVRGLLCHPCNLGLGHFGDDVTKLRAAAGYLEGNPFGGRADGPPKGEVEVQDQPQGAMK